MLFNTIYKLSLQLKGTAIGEKIYRFLDNIGLRILLSRVHNYFLAQKNFKTPTQEMLESRIFFDQYKEEVNKVIALLEDEDSKKCYKKMVDFRCWSNYSQLPFNSYHTQYFLNDFFVYKSGEVFIDCGAYDGDTIYQFKRLMKRKKLPIGTVIGVEADEQNCIRLAKNHPDVKIIHGGAWDAEELLRFDVKNSDASRICTEEDESCNMNMVQGLKLDEIDICRGASFIKMDIEGAEQRALHGLKDIISNNKPKLAICIYHSDEDMISIPLWLHELCPSYKLYVRQHANARCETVLYATE